MENEIIAMPRIGDKAPEFKAVTELKILFCPVLDKRHAYLH